MNKVHITITGLKLSYQLCLERFLNSLYSAWLGSQSLEPTSHRMPSKIKVNFFSHIEYFLYILQIVFNAHRYFKLFCHYCPKKTITLKIYYNIDFHRSNFEHCIINCTDLTMLIFIAFVSKC